MASGAKSSKDAAAQVPPTRQTGKESATGVALEQADHEIPQGKDRGSKTPIEGGTPKPDVERPKPTGAQLEPARFTSNGQIPHNTIPSPSGSVPVGATTLSPEDAKAKVQDVLDKHDAFVNRRSQRQYLAPETVQRLQPLELRAIGQERGYDIPDSGGVRAVRQAFIEAQDSDKDLQKRAAGTKRGGSKRSTHSLK